MKQFFITKILKYFRGRIAAKVNRLIILLVFLALAHIPWFAHICLLFQIPPDALAGAAWAALLEGLHWLRDSYPQTGDYINPVIEGIEETGKPEISNTAVEAQPVNKP